MLQTTQPSAASFYLRQAKDAGLTLSVPKRSLPSITVQPSYPRLCCSTDSSYDPMSTNYLHAPSRSSSGSSTIPQRPSGLINSSDLVSINSKSPSRSNSGSSVIQMPGGESHTIWSPPKSPSGLNNLSSTNHNVTSIGKGYDTDNSQLLTMSDNQTTTPNPPSDSQSDTDNYQVHIPVKCELPSLSNDPYGFVMSLFHPPKLDKTYKRLDDHGSTSKTNKSKPHT